MERAQYTQYRLHEEGKRDTVFSGTLVCDLIEDDEVEDMSLGVEVYRTDGGNIVISAAYAMPDSQGRRIMSTRVRIFSEEMEFFEFMEKQEASMLMSRDTFRSDAKAKLWRKAAERIFDKMDATREIE